MKNYGNMVKKYASGKVSFKYKPIVAKSNAEYELRQLADLERFLKEDMITPKHLDNQAHYDALIAGQRKILEAEVARLKGQVKVVKEEVVKKCNTLITIVQQLIIRINLLETSLGTK